MDPVSTPPPSAFASVLRTGLAGLMIAGGLGTVFAVSCIVSPPLREAVIKWRLDHMVEASDRQIAAAQALRYDSSFAVLLWWSVLLAIWGLSGGMLLGSIVCKCKVSLRFRLVPGTTFLILSALLTCPFKRGLVFEGGRDQFDWIAELEQPVSSSHGEAIAAATTLLKRPPFPGRARLISALANQGDQAVASIAVLDDLRGDPEREVREQAEVALQILSESWERQVDAVRGGVSNRIEMVHHPVTDEQLLQLATECERLEVLLLDRTELSEDTLVSVLPHLTSLKRLKIGGHVSRELFPILSTLTSLEVLNLPDADCPDGALTQLQVLPKLNLLRIRSSGITDTGLPALQLFPDLKYLHLIGTSITNEGLQHIAKIKGLQSFYLDGSRCTESGLSDLLKTRPDLHVHWNDLHLDGDPNTDDHPSQERF